MDRRKFFKLTGGGITAGTAAIILPIQAKPLELDEYVKKVIEPAMEVATQDHSNSYGYARYVKDYDIIFDRMVYRLDVIDETGTQRTVEFHKGSIEEAKRMMRSSAIGRFKPIPVTGPPMTLEYIKI